MAHRLIIAASEFLEPTYRGGDEDWLGDSAFTFIRNAVEATYNADSTIATPAVPRNLTDCSARGLLYRREFFYRFPLSDPIQAPVGLAGDVVDALAGEFTLGLPKVQVRLLQPQHREDPFADYILRALLTDPLGIENWVGTLPVYVL